jgi:hypothetical protein
MMAGIAANSSQDFLANFGQKFDPEEKSSAPEVKTAA